MSNENPQYLITALNLAKAQATSVLAAWGNDGGREQYDRHFAAAAEIRGITLVCLGTTLSGAPKHPMARGKHRIPRDQQPIPWKAAA